MHSSKSSGNAVTIAHALEGKSVYINDQYYRDIEAGIIEIPRFGWSVKSVVNEVATIQYQRKNIMLNMTLMIETRYLRVESAD